MSADKKEQTELMTPENGLLAVLNKSEIDQQIATAHQFPRSVRKFLDEGRQLVTLNEAVADDCIYALPRDNKTIEGASARFAEIMAHSWGNCRAGARVISTDGEFVTSQGVFHDLEKNVAITYEVQRRIVDKHGKRFKIDMIGVTANAACSIALRNAVLKGIPKAFWGPLYEDARKVVMGDAKTLANRRATALVTLQKLGATDVMVFKLLGVAGVEDVTLEHLVVLRGIATAIKDGDTTVENAFAEQAGDKPAIKTPEAKSDKAAESKPQKSENSGDSGSQAPSATEPEKGAAASTETVDTETGEILPADGPEQKAAEQKPASKPKAEKPAPPPANGPYVSAGMMIQVRSKLQRQKQYADEAALCAGLGIASLDKLPQARINDVLIALQDAIDAGA